MGLILGVWSAFLFFSRFIFECLSGLTHPESVLSIPSVAVSFAFSGRANPGERVKIRIKQVSPNHAVADVISSRQSYKVKFCT
jgi:hypothetical protein